ncbi:acylglycerol kinase family protein [Candidatus Saccharibacteria bacterium]|nr:acylglycerol kinase family protein [Candidatus Saccharibacteria bacterium]
MKRLLVVYNLKSSRFKDVEREVLVNLRNLNGYMIGKYEIQRIGVDKNVEQFAKLVEDGDLVLSVGGDATGVIAANGVLKSGKDATLAVLPYGNFNDLARTLGTKKLEDVLDGKTRKMWPLEILVDGKHYRYATCYTTIGMTAEAVELFDDSKVRKGLQKGHKSSWRSYILLMKWYFKNRHKKVFLPEFKLNGVPMHKKTSDYAAVNGRRMCRVMKGNDSFLSAKKFRHMTGKLVNLWNLTVLMARSILRKVPGRDTTGDVLEFIKPSTVEVQAEGEYQVFTNISKIEIKKSEKPLKVIMKK